MKDKFGMLMLAILCAIAIVASSMAIYSYIAADVDKGIGEGGGRDVFSLMPPPFICAASASELDGVGDAFPEDEAGISSYVNVGQSINITEAINAYIQLEVSSSKELEEAIENGKIAEHPSWEDLILIENIDAKIKKLEKEIANIESLPGT